MTERASGGGMSQFSAALSQRYGPFKLEPVRAAMMARGSLRGRSFERLGLTVVTARHVICQRQRLSGDRENLLAFLAPLEGGLVVEQHGRAFAVARGGVLIVDAAAACNLIVESHCQALSVEVDRRTLRSFGATRGFRADIAEIGSRMGGLLSMILTSVAADMDGYGPQDGEFIEELLLPTMARIVGRAREDMPGRSGLQTDHIEQWARANIHDPALSVDRLAQAFGVTRRAVFRHFAASGTTPARWLWALRLQCADERLISGRGTVSEIAYSVGFNDSSHFARLFKRQYGQTPTLRRKAAMRE